MSKAIVSQDISYKAIKNLSGSEQEKINFMTENMHINKAFLYLVKNKSKKEKDELLIKFKNIYLKYRN